MIHLPLPVAKPPEVEDKGGRRSAIYYLMLALSDRCNLRCTYCFVNKTPRKMSPQTARQAIDFFLHRNITGTRPILGLTFFGGEPLIETDLIETVVDYIGSLRGGHLKSQILYTATTNGTLASPRIERIVRDTNMELLVSLDGGEDAASYRPFENGTSSYGIVAKNLKKLVSWASKAVVRMTYHPSALDFIGNVSQALEFGAPAVILAPVVEANWKGREEALEQAYQDLADWFIREARQGRLLPLESSWILLRQVHSFLKGAGAPSRPCGVGTELLAIDPDGNVMPCHRFLYRPQDWLGTVKSQHLSARRNRYLELESRNFSGCQGCVARPVCGGGCRAVALDAGLGLLEPHPGHCLTTRAHARAVYRIYETMEDEENLHFFRALSSNARLSDALTELALR